MKSVNPNLVFCQCLSNLPKNALACPIFNYDARKLSDFEVVKVFILANLCGWNNLRKIETGIRAKKDLQKEITTESFSHSQLSRRLAGLDTGQLADLLGRLASHFWLLKGASKGLHPNVGLIRIIDGTYVKLPNNAADWTAISKDSSGIKLHVRVAVADANCVFPEKMIPSTGNVSDSDAVNHIIDADETLYVMDRGYAHKTKIGGWLQQGIHFLVRCRKNFRMETLRSFKPTNPRVIKNELVSMLTRKEPLRYIYFKDDTGKDVHLLTERVELTEDEILETYKNRWYIELFFKWLKQHVKLDHLFSHSPTGIWNQMFIALITVALVEIMRLKIAPGKSAWTFLSTLQEYLFNPIGRLKKDFNRPLRKSNGRQKIPDRAKKSRDFGEDHAIVSPINRQHFVEKEKEKKRKKALEKDK
ncbi:IS4 family transposase [Sporosarcina sp. FSL W7-1283]|uniref:IS4 family transposase n=1 Tax=Sporosarcina sp. FSL W7-1283 TaxID=2921560 RepID=UPI0030F67A80